MVKRIIRTAVSPQKSPTRERVMRQQFNVCTPPVASVLDTQITVISGAHVQSLPLVNMTVRNARHLLQASFNIGPQAMALINGRPVQPETVLQQGDTLEFVHHAGEKGGAGGGICLR